MKAKKIDLASYKVTVNAMSPLVNKILATGGVESCLRDSERWGKDELDSLLTRGSIVRDYDVKGSMINVLFTLRISGREAWEKRDPLAKKIKIHDGEVLLEADEYAMLLKAFEGFQGAGRNEEELLKRIFEAEEVEMEEKKEAKK